MNSNENDCSSFSNIGINSSGTTFGDKINLSNTTDADSTSKRDQH